MANTKLLQRKRRVRAKIEGTADRPRLSVFRSNRHIYAQIIDDVKGKTIVAFSDDKLKKENIGKTRKETAENVGLELAKLAKAKKITKIAFDRNGYKYHGRVAALADGLRKGGLNL